MSDRWRIEYVPGEWTSVCGPDYEQESEFRVVDAATGEVVLTFSEYGDSTYMVGTRYWGAATVELTPDGCQVVVTDHDGTRKTVALPARPEGPDAT